MGASMPKEPEPVFELRVHGVNNTPPHIMLGVAAGAVTRVDGDALGGFWRVDPTRSGRRGQEAPGAPPGVLREAYSWGGLARTTLTVRGLGAALVGLVARTGWALLMPFGLVNVAFWSRRPEGGRASNGWHRGRQAGALRVFGLLLTLLMLASASVVSLDLLATQCFAGGRVRCVGLPPGSDAVTTWRPGARLAVASVLPLAVLSLLVLLGRVTRTRYEQRTHPVLAGRGAGPALANRGFWANARLTSTAGRAHGAAGLCFMVATTAWHQVFATGPACSRPLQVVGSGAAACWAQVLPPPTPARPFVVTLVAALVGLLAVTAELAAPGWASRSGRRSTPVAQRVTAHLAGAGALFVLNTVLLARTTNATDPRVPLLGLVVTPALITAALLVIAVSATRWRGAAPGDGASAERPGGRPYEAWHGRAPAVFLLMALGLGLSLSSLVVVGAGDWLNGRRPAQELLRRAVDAPVAPEPGPATLSIPTVYVWFGGMVFLGLLGAAVVAAWSIHRTSATLPAAAGTPPVPGPPDEGVRARARRWAAVAQRAEPAAGVLAGATGAGAAAALLFAVVIAVWPGAAPPQLRGAAAAGWVWGAYRAVVDAAVWSVALVGLVVLVGLAGGAVLGRARPLALVWDLICFLPRAGHPFGPPCYAERVVPELVHRCEAWLRVAPSRRVVLSAHSLGAVLTAATVLAVREQLPDDRVERISLLTYGTQLRPYFGRMFPELLGTGAVGTAASRGAWLLTPDPWTDVVAEDTAALDRPDAPPPPRSLLDVLTDAQGRTRWVNLWRRTDPLGFPADRYVGGRVDRPAEEVEPGPRPRVGGHGGYPATEAYDEAFTHLLALRPTPRPEDAPTG